MDERLVIACSFLVILAAIFLVYHWIKIQLDRIEKSLEELKNNIYPAIADNVWKNKEYGQYMAERQSIINVRSHL